MVKLGEINCVVNVYRINRTVEGEDFTTGDRQRIVTEGLMSIKPISTQSVDTTYGDMTQGVWSGERDNDSGEVIGVHDVVEVVRSCYGNDPVRVLEGRYLDVMEAVPLVGSTKVTLREARDS